MRRPIASGRERPATERPEVSGREPPASRRHGTWFWPLIIAVTLLNLWFVSTLGTAAQRVQIPYSPAFLDQVRDGNVVAVTFSGDKITGRLRKAIRYPADSTAPASTTFATRQPPPPSEANLLASLRGKGVTIEAKAPETGLSLIWNVVIGFGPTLLLVGGFIWLMRRAGASGAGGLMGFGRSRARLYERGATPVTFADVAGIDEAKEELTQIVGFLKTPEPFRRLGARIPRGVLLSGPPGTGKTLLARAVAGEAGVPFFSMSGSEFIEMIVGVGASRVRDLFAQAKAAAPAIVFIDELDAIGRSRSGGVNLGGGSEEREQTLNQILTEMDGFDATTGVIVIAATNRPDVLDPALLRAGRFDRRVAVQPPDREGRLAILRVHTRGMPLAADADLGRVASETPGMVGADLASLANEAALTAASSHHTTVELRDFEDALTKTMLGSARRVVLSAHDRERTAYHEAGHALVGMLSPVADPVRAVSIIPRGAALGITFSAPDADRYGYTREELRTKIRVAIGGRAAEELVYGEVTTGAESDIEQLTGLARRMAGRWGMSDAIGPIAVLPRDDMLVLPGVDASSPQSHQLLESEVHRIVDEAHREATELLTEHRPQLDALARALLEAETLDGPAAYAAASLPARKAPALPDAAAGRTT